MSEQIFEIGIKALIQNTKGELLLTLTSFPERDLWDIPGGRIDEGEEILDTLARELKEEIGVEEFQVVKQLMTVKSPKKIPYAGGEIALALVVYVVQLGEAQTPVSKETNAKIYWKSIPEAAELLLDKYPSEFCEMVRAL